MEPREPYATGFSYRAVDAEGRLRRAGGLLRGATEAADHIFLRGGTDAPEALAMAVLLSASGTAFPVLSGEFEEGGAEAITALEGLGASRAARAYRPGACVGASAQVDALERAMRWTPELSVEYDAMSLAPGAPSPGAATASPGAAPGLAQFRRAAIEDLDALYPLAAEYEKSEVLTPLHAFDPAACRAGQARSLRLQVVYLAEVRGLVVARAQTNARGWAYDQIGGVFVHPAYRGLGIGRGVMDALVADIAARGRGAALFVKKRNPVARSLYLGMGFTIARDYRVSYFR